MAITSDMKKCNDKLDWTFTRNALLIWVFFSDTWISWMMQCITNSSFKVIINDKK